MDIEKLLVNNLLNVITESIIVVNLKGIITYWNKGAESIFGYSKKEMIGNPVTTIYPDYNKNKYNEDIRRIEKGESHIGEWEGRRKDGSKVWVNLRSTLLKNEKNEIIGYIGISHDITEIVNSRLYKNQLTSIIEFSDDGIESMDLNGTILSWNKGAEYIYGYKADEIVGKNAFILYTKNNKDELKRNLELIKSGKPLKNFETTRIRKDGKKINISLTLSPLKDKNGRINGISVITRDITKQKQIIKELQESELKYQTIFENSGEGFLLMTDKFIDVNKKVAELIGYQKDELIGKTPVDFSPKYQADGTPSTKKAKKYTATAFKKGYMSFYWQLLNKNSEIVETRISLNKISINGKPHLISVVQDLTELYKYQNKLKAKTKELVIQNEEFSKLNKELAETNKQLKIINRQIEENEKKFRIAFKTSPDAININRLTDGLCIEINEGFTQLLGYTEDEAIGKTLDEIGIWVKKKDRDKMVKKLNKDGFISNLETSLRKKDRTITTVLISASIIEIKQEKYILSITRDISERKDFEEKLKQATKKAEESDKLKSAFLANMSHEIRTPMNAILGFTQLLKEKKLTREKQMKYFNIVISRSKNLLDIINDIIDISKIEANQLDIEIQRFSLNKLLYELFANYEMELLTQNKKDVKLEYKTGFERSLGYIESDELRLKQILNNLINNAVKFTEKGKIEFGYTVKGNFLEFFVRDTGIGIPKEYHRHIFERFRQADVSSTREYGGTGLGLSICKQLVDLLGGKIWFESKTQMNTNGNPQGSTFYFMIPHKHNIKSGQIKIEKKATNMDLKNKTILIVEDDMISMAYLEELLTGTNVNIIKAYDGIQALEKFKENQNIDLVLMDIHLPKLNGNEATKKMKSINKSIPVIAQSAFAMSHDKEQSFKYGCDEYLIKPIDPRLFFSTLKKYLKQTT